MGDKVRMGDVTGSVVAAGRGSRASGVVAHSMEWLGLAVASGVVGNLTYDILKYRYQWARDRISGYRVLNVWGSSSRRDLLAVLAIELQCERHGINCPPLKTLLVAPWKEGAEGASTTVSSRRHKFHADVIFPLDSRAPGPLVRIVCASRRTSKNADSTVERAEVRFAQGVFLDEERLERSFPGARDVSIENLLRAMRERHG